MQSNKANHKAQQRRKQCNKSQNIQRRIRKDGWINETTIYKTTTNWWCWCSVVDIVISGPLYATHEPKVLLTHFLKGLPDLLCLPSAQLPRHTDALLEGTEQNAVLSESRHVFSCCIVNEMSKSSTHDHEQKDYQLALPYLTWISGWNVSGVGCLPLYMADRNANTTILFVPLDLSLMRYELLCIDACSWVVLMLLVISLIIMI